MGKKKALRPADLVTADVAAKMAERSKSSVRSWVRAGKLKGYRANPSKSNSALMVSKTELLAYLSMNLGTETSVRAVKAPKSSDNAAPSDLDLNALKAELEALRREKDLLVSLIKKEEQVSIARAYTIQAHESTIAQLRSDVERLNESHDRLVAEQKRTLVYLSMPWWRRWNASIPLLPPQD